MKYEDYDRVKAEFHILVMGASKPIALSIARYFEAVKDFPRDPGLWKSFKAQVFGNIEELNKQKHAIKNDLGKVFETNTLDIKLLDLHKSLLVDGLNAQVDEIDERLKNNGKTTELSSDYGKLSLDSFERYTKISQEVISAIQQLK